MWIPRNLKNAILVNLVMRLTVLRLTGNMIGLHFKLSQHLVKQPINEFTVHCYQVKNKHCCDFALRSL